MGTSLLNGMLDMFGKSTDTDSAPADVDKIFESDSTDDVQEPQNFDYELDTLSANVGSSKRKTTKPNPDSATVQSSHVNLIAIVRNSVDSEIAVLQSELRKLEIEKAELLKKIEVHEELKQVINEYDSGRVDTLRI